MKYLAVVLVAIMLLGSFKPNPKGRIKNGLPLGRDYVKVQVSPTYSWSVPQGWTFILQGSSVDDSLEFRPDIYVIQGDGTVLVESSEEWQSLELTETEIPFSSGESIRFSIKTGFIWGYLIAE